MAFEKVQDLSTDNVIALGGVNKKTGKANPKSIEGYYLGSRQVESKKSKTGKAYIHVFQTPKGNIGVWGKTDSDRKILTVPPGTMTRVTHTGFQSTPNGDMYKYDVERDLTNTITVEGFADLAVANNGSNEDYKEDDNWEDQDNFEDADSSLSEIETVQPSRVAAMSSSDRQARTMELLKGKSKR